MRINKLFSLPQQILLSTFVMKLSNLNIRGKCALTFIHQDERGINVIRINHFEIFRLIIYIFVGPWINWCLFRSFLFDVLYRQMLHFRLLSMCWDSMCPFSSVLTIYSLLHIEHSYFLFIWGKSNLFRWDLRSASDLNCFSQRSQSKSLALAVHIHWSYFYFSVIIMPFFQNKS